MSRTLTRWLDIVGAIFVASYFILPNVSPAVNQWGDQESQNGAIFLTVHLWAALGFGLLGVALLGALSTLSHLQQWPWFWILLGSGVLAVLPFGFVVPPVVVLVYSFMGPTTPALKHTRAAASPANRT
jgi:hypothetical protein